MASRGWLRRRAVIFPVMLALVAAAAVVLVVVSRPAPVHIRNLYIPVTDGPQHDQHVLLDASFFTPGGTGRLPAILLAHGFGQTKYAVQSEAEYLARSGFAVLTWSARGFGRSTGQSALDAPAYEVADTEQLVTWLAHQPRVLLDGPGNPRVGIAGASYGGGLALLAAAYDHRIDAVAAETTWNNLGTALLPNAAGGGPANGVLKRQWAGLLFTQGTAGFGPGSGSIGGRPATSSHRHGGPGAGTGQGGAGQAGEGLSGGLSSQLALCGRLLPSVCSAYQQMARQGRPTPQALSLLWRSSPASVANRMTAPTLLIQGEHDSLFGFDQADANYRDIRRNGAPAGMVWFSGGHDGGNQETARIGALTGAWFHRWLNPGHAPASAGTGQPGFAVTRPLGFDPSTGTTKFGIAAGARYPGLGGSTRGLVRLTGPPQTVVNPAGGSPPSMSILPGLGSLGSGGGGGAAAGITFDMPGQTAAFSSAPLRTTLQVTGSPTVRVRVSGSGPVTLFAAVYDVDSAGNALLPYLLVTPMRVTATPAGTAVTVHLPAIDYAFPAGHELRVAFTTTDWAYSTPTVASVSRVALAGPGVTVPQDPSLVLVSGGLPWWVWALPLMSLVAAVVIVAARRRDRDTGVPELVDVPLEINGLTKRYADGQLAVDDLSLRVERGQILGLLGPNGAGKTTTLRALMGLLHPDAGTITIFGRQVHAGSAALSRLGSFVEGPGFLPHLSGRANLDLYWRATGRPVGDSHLEEVLAVAGLGAAIDRAVRTYSRGMCQRLAIAQAMLGLPDLLVLDEPMNGLDPPQISHMREVLLRYAAGGRTVILSSHLLGEVEQTCSHVVVMSYGRRLAAGPVSEIIGAGGGLLVGTSQAEQAVTVLRGLAGIEAAEPHPSGVLVHPNGVHASAVVAALVEAGVPVERVGPSRSLEEAFLALISPAEISPADVSTADISTGDISTAESGER